MDTSTYTVGNYPLQVKKLFEPKSESGPSYRQIFPFNSALSGSVGGGEFIVARATVKVQGKF